MEQAYIFHRGESECGFWFVCGVQSEDELVAEKKCVAHLIGEVSVVPNIRWEGEGKGEGGVCVCMESEFVAPLGMIVRFGQRV